MIGPRVGGDWQSRGYLILFYESLASRTSLNNDDDEEIAKYKALELHGCQALIDLILHIRNLPEFVDVNPGRRMAALGLQREGSDKEIYVGVPGKGMFRVRVENRYTSEEVPGLDFTVSNDDIVATLSKLIREL